MPSRGPRSKNERARRGHHSPTSPGAALRDDDRRTTCPNHGAYHGADKCRPHRCTLGGDVQTEKTMTKRSTQMPSNCSRRLVELRGALSTELGA
eukprot:scaffold3769_cov37-Tisochrysis_lutea.AAC.4